MADGSFILTSLNPVQIGEAIGIGSVAQQLTAAAAQLTSAAAQVVTATAILATLTTNAATLATNLTPVQAAATSAQTNANILGSNSTTALTTSQAIVTTANTNQTNVNAITSGAVSFVRFNNDRIIQWAGNGTTATPFVPSVFATSATSTGTLTVGAATQAITYTFFRIGNVVHVYSKGVPTYLAVTANTNPIMSIPIPSALYAPNITLTTPQTLVQPWGFQLQDGTAYPATRIITFNGGLTVATATSSVLAGGAFVITNAGNLAVNSLHFEWQATPTS